MPQSLLDDAVTGRQLGGQHHIVQQAGVVGHHQHAAQGVRQATHPVVEHPQPPEQPHKQPETLLDAGLGQGAAPLPPQAERQ
ncbi:hypothetical protein D3C72_1040530 [compost metagenome]